MRHIERCKILLHLIDLSEEDLINSYKKIKLELLSYDKILDRKKEIIFFNKSDLFEKNDIDKKLREFKNKIKTKFEVISVLSIEDIKRVKKLLIKNVN